MIYGTADTMYTRGFYTPGPADPEFRGGGHEMLCGLLPGFVPVRPGHVPSTVTFVAPLPDVSGAFGGRRRRWVQLSRTVCGCGRVWSRSRQVSSGRVPDDVALRSLHADHTASLPAVREVAA